MSDQKNISLTDKSYLSVLAAVKQRIVVAQHKAARYVNSELLFTYWHIGHQLNLESALQGWGAKVVERLAQDLKKSFPEMKGLSKRNLQYMMKFAAEWPLDSIVPQVVTQIQNADNQENTIVPQAVAQFKIFEEQDFARIPWSHHRLLLDKAKNKEERLFYCQQIVANNWSRSLLQNKIEQGLFQSKGQLNNNFTTSLPEAQAALAQQTFKDPYFFDFLQLGNEASEKEIEDRLTQQIGKFLLELGAGFAYLGRQYKLEVGGQEYYLDLLFFHTIMNCYVNIELKIDEFKPEYAGKSQFYLTAIDEQLKAENHNPSVGIILCKETNNIVVEYTLKQSSSPLGVAEYTLVKELPQQLEGLLPSPDQLKASLKKD